MLEIEDMKFIADVAVMVVDEIITRLPDPDPRVRHNWNTTGKQQMIDQLAKMIPSEDDELDEEEDDVQRSSRRWRRRNDG